MILAFLEINTYIWVTFSSHMKVGSCVESHAFCLKRNTILNGFTHTHTSKVEKIMKKIIENSIAHKTGKVVKRVSTSKGWHHSYINRVYIWKCIEPTTYQSLFDQWKMLTHKNYTFKRNHVVTKQICGHYLLGIIHLIAVSVRLIVKTYCVIQLELGFT